MELCITHLHKHRYIAYVDVCLYTYIQKNKEVTGFSAVIQKLSKQFHKLCSFQNTQLLINCNEVSKNIGI